MSAQSRLFRVTPWLLGGAFVLVLAGTVFSFRLVAPPAALDLAATGRVVVLPVVNATGEREHDWVRLGLTEMIAETLRRTRGVQVVAPERLPRVIAARGLDPEDDEMRRRVRELGLAAGAGLVADVAARRRAGRRGDDGVYSLALEVLDARGGVVGESEVRGADLTRLAERLTYLLAEALAGGAEPVGMSRVYTPSPFLNRLHGMGLAALHGAGPEAAEPFFEIAVAVQPSFLAARYRIAECARRAGRVAASRQLFLEVLAEAQNRGERVWEARSLHALALTEALAGNVNEALRLAEQVRSLTAVADEDGARLAVLSDLARFALASGDAARARLLYGEIGGLQGELGDRLGRADTLAQLGALGLRAADLEAAEETFNEARALAEELGDVRIEMQALASLGEVASRQGRNSAAVEMWRRAATFYEQRGERSRRLLLARNIAEALLLGGELEQAEEAFHDVRELALEQGDESLEALAALRLTWILLRRGYPYQARVHLERAMELDRRLDEPLTLQRLIAWMAYEEGNYPLAVATLAAVKRQAGEDWRQIDEGFLEVFTRALERGERLPVPGESGVLGPG